MYSIPVCMADCGGDECEISLMLNDNKNWVY